MDTPHEATSSESQSKRSGERFVGLIDWLLLAVVVGVLACWLLGFGGRWWWRLAILEHLRGQLLLVAVVATAWFALRRSVVVVPAALGVFVSAWFVAPVWIGSGGGQVDSAYSLTVSHLNIDRDHVDALGELAARGPEIVFVQEFTPTVADVIAERLPGYEMVLANPRSDSTHGSAMLIRQDWDGTVSSADVVNIPPTSERPLLLAEVEFQGQMILLLSLHTTRPSHAAVYHGQQIELAGVADWSREQVEDGCSVVVIGDFNTTPYASNFRRLLVDGRLENGLRGHGWQTSWPASVPGFLQLPIDLVVHSDDIIMVEAETGPSLGPDHRPLHVEFVVM